MWVSFEYKTAISISDCKGSKPVSRSSLTLAAIEFAVGETRTIQKCRVLGALRAPSYELRFVTKRLAASRSRGLADKAGKA